MQGYSLTIYEPLVGTSTPRVVSEFDLNPEITQLAFSTGKGGFNGLTVGLRDPAYPQAGYLPHSVAVNGFNHVTLEKNGVLVWEGRIMRPPLTGSEVNGFSAVGYGATALDDKWFNGLAAGVRDTTQVSAGPLLKEILAACAPLIVVAAAADEFVDSGIQYMRGDFHGLPPSQAVSRMSNDGGGQLANSSGDGPYDFLVYDGRRATFKPRVAPPPLTGTSATVSQGPAYLIDFDAEVTWDPDFTDCVGDVTVEYTGGATDPDTRQAVSSTFVDRYGFQRSVYLQLGATDDVQAQQYARTYLALHEVPLTAVTINRSDWRGLRTPSGGERPPELVRAGEWLQVGDQSPLYIVGTQVDCNQGTLTVNGTNYERAYWLALQALDRLMRAMALGLNPNSGAPA